MQLFLDSADRVMIKKWMPTGLVDGVTTNPSLLSKQGLNTKDVIVEICSMVEGDVSVEVVEKEPSLVYKQARQIAELAENVVVKIPFAMEYLPIINQLSRDGIAMNITLVFSVVQALMVAKLGVSYVSPFIGRLDDVGQTGVDLISDLVTVFDRYDFETEILAASIRSVEHWRQVALMGADVATVPPAIFEQAMHHNLTKEGIAKFDADWASLGKKSLLE